MPSERARSANLFAVATSAFSPARYSNRSMSSGNAFAYRLGSFLVERQRLIAGRRRAEPEPRFGQPLPRRFHGPVARFGRVLDGLRVVELRLRVAFFGGGSEYRDRPVILSPERRRVDRRRRREQEHRRNYSRDGFRNQAHGILA